jgi:anti-sigma factor RsiW
VNTHWSAGDVERFADGESSLDPRHLQECPECAKAVLATVQMKHAVRDAMRTEPAPDRLRRRVAQRTPWWIAVAAILATIVVAFALRTQSDPTAELVDLHVTALASANPVDVVSTDRHTVKPWFEGRVPFAVPIPELSSTPFRLIGGRVVFFRNAPVAQLLIGKGSHRISVFVLRDGPKALSSPSGHSVLRWESNGLTFVAVAEVPESDLTQLREAFLNIDASSGVH